MSILSTKKTQRNWVRTGTFPLTVLKDATILEIGGSGVVKTPGFKSKKRPARLKPLSYTKYWKTSNNGSDFNEETDTFSFFNRSEGPISSVFAMFDTTQSIAAKNEADYRALNKLFDNLKGEGTNIANMFGERHQVVQQVETCLNTLINTVRDLRHGRLASAVRRMAGDPYSARKLRKLDIANQWIALKYGWEPLISDVYGLVNGLHYREKTFPKVIRGTGKFESDRVMGESWAIDVNGTSHGNQNTVIKQKFMLRCFPDIALAEPAALGVTNPLEVLWEVTPWSFVVDWFLPVGNYLDQLTADHGWIFSDGCKSVLEKSSAKVNFNAYKQVTPTHYIKQFRYGYWTFDEFTRTTLGGIPSARLPMFKNPLSVIHIANGIALLSQLMGRK